jgi:hypothetical protein
LATEFKRYPVILGEARIFPPEPGAKRERQRVDKSFGTILELAGVEDFRFHDPRHTFASWYKVGVCPFESFAGDHCQAEVDGNAASRHLPLEADFLFC